MKNVKFLFYLLSVFSFLNVSGETTLGTWDGVEYANNSQWQKFQFEKFFDYTILKGNENALDVGCGDGKLTALLAEKIPQGSILGIDNSTSMIQFARARLNERHNNLSFAEADARTFSFNQSFDLVISNYVLHWMKDQSVALKNIYNHLNPSGRLFFIVAAPKDGLPFDQALKTTMYEWREYFQEFESDLIYNDIETYRKLIVDAGFRLDSISLIATESKYLNRESLKNWIKQWLPPYKHLTDEAKEKFMEELLECYLSDPRSYNICGDIIWREYAIVVNAARL